MSEPKRKIEEQSEERWRQGCAARHTVKASDLGSSGRAWLPVKNPWRPDGQVLSYR